MKYWLAVLALALVICLLVLSLAASLGTQYLKVG